MGKIVKNIKIAKKPAKKLSDRHGIIIMGINERIEHSILNRSWENHVSPIALRTDGWTDRHSELYSSFATKSNITTIEDKVKYDFGEKL